MKIKQTPEYITLDHSSHLPAPVAMSSGEAEYISAAAACMRASHLRMLIYDLKYLATPKYDGDVASPFPHISVELDHTQETS